MGLDALVRSMVRTAARIADDLLVDVDLEVFTDFDGDGAPTYEDAVTYRAYYEKKGTILNWRIGKEVVDASMITFIGNVPVDMRDRLTLPDGTHPPILDVLGVADPAGGTYYTQVTCGRPERGVTVT